MSFFRARAGATQSISASTETEVVFGTELADPDGVFASNRFTVPAGWNGRVGGLSAGYQSDGTENPLIVSIQKQTGGVGGFVSIVSSSNAARDVVTLGAYPIVFATGDVYRVVVFQSAGTKRNEPVNYFSGWVFPDPPTKLGLLRAEVTTVTATLSANNWIGIDSELGTPIIDSHSVLSGGVITIPSAFNGGFLHITGGLVSLADTIFIGIQKSTDGGTTWLMHAQDRVGGGAFEAHIDAGADAAVTGQMYRLAAFQSGSNFTIADLPRCFLSAALFKY